MWEDPIVAEVHRTRQKIAEQFHFDLQEYFADIRKRQSALGDRLVAPGQRPKAAATADRKDQPCS